MFFDRFSKPSIAFSIDFFEPSHASTISPNNQNSPNSPQYWKLNRVEALLASILGQQHYSISRYYYITSDFDFFQIILVFFHLEK